MDGESLRVKSGTTRQHFTIERMNALTEGVYAIVLTLLVLELKLPEGDESVLQLLADDWHVFVAWVISFAAIGRFWLVHHAITAHLKHVDNHTLRINLAVLAAVTLMPFSADAIGTEALDEPWSTVLFALNVGVLSATIGLLALHAERERHLLHDEGHLPRISRHRRAHLVVLPCVTAAAAALAFVHPYLAVGLIMSEFLVFAWWGRGD